MIEHHIRQSSLGVQRMEEPDEQGNSFRLLIVDGRVDNAGNLIPGSGSGQIFWVYMDDAAASVLRQGIEDAKPSAVARVGKPKMVVPRGNGHL